MSQTANELLHPHPRKVHSAFAELYANNNDPWDYTSCWYEARKRAVLLACLPQQRYENAYEPGCSNGELAAALAPRCAKLLATDGVAAAVSLARARLASFANVQVAQQWLPQDWAVGSYDLIVISEFGFYLSADELSALIQQAKASLRSGGTLVACHWLHPIEGFSLNGQRVHDLIHQQIDLPRPVHHAEENFVLDMWCAHSHGATNRSRLGSPDAPPFK